MSGLDMDKVAENLNRMLGGLMENWYKARIYRLEVAIRCFCDWHDHTLGRGIQPKCSLQQAVDELREVSKKLFERKVEEETP